MSEADGKNSRLASALRANLARRKAQARARRSGDEARASDGPDPRSASPHEGAEPEASAGESDPARVEHKERIVPEGEAG